MTESTAQKILDIAQCMVQKRGYNAFSYADISEQIGIRKASIHYHFATKDDLVMELVNRYRERTRQICQGIEQTVTDPDQQLRHFAALYRESLREQRLCMCGMLTADFAVLPEKLQGGITAFLADNVAWLQSVLERGSAAGVFHCQNPVEIEAKRLLAIFQGAQLIARTDADPERRATLFDQIVQPDLDRLLGDR